MTNIFVTAWQGQANLKLVFWLLFLIPGVLFIVGSMPIYFLAHIATVTVSTTGYATSISLFAPVPWLTYMVVVLARSASNVARSKLLVLMTLMLVAFVMTYGFLISEYQAGLQSIG